MPKTPAAANVVTYELQDGARGMLVSRHAEVDDTTSPLEPDLSRWVSNSARAVAAYYGRFPTRTRLFVETGGGGKVRGGVTFGTNPATIRVWADARARGGDDPAAFGTALERWLAATSYELVAAELPQLREISSALTPDMSRTVVTDVVGPEAADGRIDRAQASIVLFHRYAMRHIAPCAGVIDDIVTRTQATHDRNM